MKNILMYTDGACSGNPGPGGYGVILKSQAHSRELSAGFRKTTNNRMELRAVIEGLRILKEPCRITVYSDSRYLVDAVQKGWVHRWKKNNWYRNPREKALNVDLWLELLKLMEQHEVKFHWVRGHDGHPENERCDKLAVQAASNQNLNEDL